MNILITGGSGLLGINLALKLKDTHSISLLSHQCQTSIANTRAVQCDLCDAAQIRQILTPLLPQCDLVVHAAALADVGACEQNPDKAYALNTHMAEQMAIFCAKYDVPLVHISTDMLFDGTQRDYCETDPTAPMNVYSTTKCLAEEAVLKAFPDAIVLRTNLYGWGTTRKRSLSDWVIQQLRAHQGIQGYDDVYFTPLHTDQIAEVLLALHKKNAAGIFHASCDTRLSKYAFAVKIAEVFALDAANIEPAHYQNCQPNIPRPLDMSLSNAKLKALCPTLDLSLETGLAQLKAADPISRHQAVCAV